jgi:hypothetical protein
LTTDLQTITTKSTTLGELLGAIFPERDIAKDFERAQAWLAAQLAQLLYGLWKAVEPAVPVIECLESMPTAPGYEPLLIERDQRQLTARFIACVIVGLGKELANDARQQGQVADAIRFIAKPGRTKKAIRRRALALLGAWETVCGLEIFRAVDLSVFQFGEELKATAQGDPAACERATQMAAILAPRLSVPRGRKRSAASMTHELLSSEMTPLFGPTGSTWNPAQEDFTDRLTRATREAFSDPNFDPRPALRRAKRRSGPPTAPERQKSTN